MPQGKGTYGSKVGRPSKKKQHGMSKTKKPATRSGMGMKAYQKTTGTGTRRKS